MKALSIQQPWAWAILHAGKDVENRTWTHDYRGPLLIHASKKIDRDGYRFLQGHPDRLKAPLPAENNFLTGGIIGVATLKRMVRHVGYSWWMCGPWGWVLADPMPLGFLPCKGRLGLFEVEYPRLVPRVQTACLGCEDPTCENYCEG